ncbi:MAG: anhydro-N-acetylmuramic acid kinase [Bacteroidota bacterium]
MKKSYHAIGLMSGSSLDGLDVAYGQFDIESSEEVFKINNWKLLACKTFPFSEFWKSRLRSLPAQSAKVLMDAHAAFGSYMGEMVNRFFSEKKIDKKNIDLIASHGHTIFHEPSEGFTTQVGDGAALAIATQCTVINDFRSADIALGGQGAPLAPMADKMLFPGFDFYLNLGGIANITCNINGRFIAFDICGANQILNALAAELNLPFDENGAIASTGILDKEFFDQQYKIDFFKENYPKSLSNQWVEKKQTTLFSANNNKTANKLFTAVELTARLISDAINSVIQKECLVKENYKLWITGGGAYNHYLINRIDSYLNQKNIEIVTPEKEIIGFKEALLMALLGIMRMENTPNCMASVTGAKRDSIGGAVYIH